MRSLLLCLVTSVALANYSRRLTLSDAGDGDRAEGAMWREFGLRRALDHMPARSPGRAVIEALLARGRLTPEEARQFKRRGLRSALASMPADAPGRAVIEQLLARESAGGAIEQAPDVAPERSRTQPGPTDLAERLERLAALRERGHLSEREFELAKRKLLE
jgi:hypothetical protein